MFELIAASTGPTDWLAWASAGFAGLVSGYLLIKYIPDLHRSHKSERDASRKEFNDLANRYQTAFIEVVADLRITLRGLGHDDDTPDDTAD